MFSILTMYHSKAMIGKEYNLLWFRMNFFTKSVRTKNSDVVVKDDNNLGFT